MACFDSGGSPTLRICFVWTSAAWMRLQMDGAIPTITGPIATGTGATVALATPRVAKYVLEMVSMPDLFFLSRCWRKKNKHFSHALMICLCFLYNAKHGQILNFLTWSDTNVLWGCIFAHTNSQGNNTHRLCRI